MALKYVSLNNPEGHKFLKFCRRLLSSSYFSKPHLDLAYLCDPKNREEIAANIQRRKSIGDIDQVLKLSEELRRSDSIKKQEIENKLIEAAFKIPNKLHPDIMHLKEDPKIICHSGEKRKFSFKPLPFQEIAKKLNLVRTDGLTNLTGPRSYFLMDSLAMLEQALIDYSVNRLLQRGFQLVSVPDILDRGVIEGCGMETRGERNQVYILDAGRHGKDVCLSGTGEMGIARLLAGKRFSTSELPARIAAVTRCYRAETSKISQEKGIYRVHQFTKVEMFGVCEPEGSDRLLDELRRFQEENFTTLGLHTRSLDMPPCELGQPAHRKYDVEGHLAGGSSRWGELSSASDCSDYQARRLAITSSDSGRHLHTVNGTCCAVPRTIIALFETHQEADGTVRVPAPLVPYMGTDVIAPSRLPHLVPYKQRRDGIDCLVSK